MEFVFKWLSELSMLDAIKLFLLVALVLSVIPYFDIIAAFYKQFVLKKKLEITFFEYSTEQNIYIGKNIDGEELYIDLPDDDVFIVGTKLKLYWKVTGAYRIDIFPIAERLKGNCAQIIIDEENAHFTLIAYGFFGKKIEAHLSLPKSKLFCLDTTIISSYSNKIIRKSPILNLYPITKEAVLSNKYTQLELSKIKNWHRNKIPNLTNIDFDITKLVHPNSKKKLLYQKLEQTKILKYYSFSTQKYNNLKTNNS